MPGQESFARSFGSKKILGPIHQCYLRHMHKRAAHMQGRCFLPGSWHVLCFITEAFFDWPARGALSLPICRKIHYYLLIYSLAIAKIRTLCGIISLPPGIAYGLHQTQYTNLMDFGEHIIANRYVKNAGSHSAPLICSGLINYFQFTFTNGGRIIMYWSPEFALIADQWVLLKPTFSHSFCLPVWSFFLSKQHLQNQTW